MLFLFVLHENIHVVMLILHSRMLILLNIIIYLGCRHDSSSKIIGIFGTKQYFILLIGTYQFLLRFNKISMLIYHNYLRPDRDKISITVYSISY